MSKQPSSEDTQAQSPVAPVPPVVRRSAWRRILLGVLILACGVAIGAGAGNIITKNTERERVRQSWLNPRRTQGMMAKRIEEKLDLSPEQAKQVRDIVNQRMGAVHQIIEESRPRVREQLDLMKDEVAEVLNENQAQEWRKSFERILRPAGPPRDGHRPGPRGRRRGPDESDVSGRERRGDANDRGPRPGQPANRRPPPPDERPGPG